MPRSILPCLFSFILVAGTSLWIVTASSRLSATFDEPVYLKSGLDCWAHKTHKPLMRLGTMPMPVDVATLPLHMWFWWTSTTPDWEQDFSWMLTVARTVALVFWWNLLAQCFRLGNQVAGPWCGFWVLATVALEPNLMGHAALATTDIAVTGCMIATMVEYLRFQQAPCRLQWWKTAIWWGLALFAKASALVFVPILILSTELPGLYALWRAGGQAFWPAVRTKCKLWVGMGATAMGLVFLMVGTDFERERTFVEWAHSLGAGTFGGTMSWLAEHLRIFTNAGEGFAQQIKHNMRGHPGYLLGVGQHKAVWYHFPVLLLIKLPTWILLLVPVILWRHRLRPWLPGLIACALLLAFSVNCRVQIGVRLVFPLVVMLMVLLGMAMHDWWRFSSRRTWAPALATLLVFGWAGLTMAKQFPDGIRYINDFWPHATDPQNLVSDSNYDWGQGLLELRETIPGGPTENAPLWVAYWGADPRVNQPPCRRFVPAEQGITNQEDLQVWLRGKTVAMSATLLNGPPLPTEYELLRQFFKKHTPECSTRCFKVYSFAEK